MQTFAVDKSSMAFNYWHEKKIAQVWAAGLRGLKKNVRASI